MDVSPGRMTVVTGAGAPFGRKVVRSGVALEVPSSTDFTDFTSFELRH